MARLDYAPACWCQMRTGRRFVCGSCPSGLRPWPCAAADTAPGVRPGARRAAVLLQIALYRRIPAKTLELPWWWTREHPPPPLVRPDLVSRRSLGPFSLRPSHFTSTNCDPFGGCSQCARCYVMLDAPHRRATRRRLSACHNNADRICAHHFPIRLASQ